MKAVNPNDNDGTDNKAWDPNSVQHFGEDGKPLEKPEKPDENDEKYMKNGEFDQEAYDKDMKEYEVNGEIRHKVFCGVTQKWIENWESYMEKQGYTW